MKVRLDDVMDRDDIIRVVEEAAKDLGYATHTERETEDSYSLKDLKKSDDFDHADVMITHDNKPLMRATIMDSQIHSDFRTPDSGRDDQFLLYVFENCGEERLTQYLSKVSEILGYDRVGVGANEN